MEVAKLRGCPECAKPFFDYYAAAGWRDGEGKPVFNWQPRSLSRFSCSNLCSSHWHMQPTMIGIPSYSMRHCFATRKDVCRRLYCQCADRQRGARPGDQLSQNTQLRMGQDRDHWADEGIPAAGYRRPGRRTVERVRAGDRANGGGRIPVKTYLHRIIQQLPGDLHLAHAQPGQRVDVSSIQAPGLVVLCGRAV